MLDQMGEGTTLVCWKLELIVNSKSRGFIKNCVEVKGEEYMVEKRFWFDATIQCRNYYS